MSSLHTVPSQTKYGLIKRSGAVPKSTASAAPMVKRPHLAAFDLDDDDNDDDNYDGRDEKGRQDKKERQTGRSDISRVNQSLYSRAAPAAVNNNSITSGGGDDAMLDSAFDYDGAYDSFKAETVAKSHALSQSASAGVPVSGDC